MRWLDYLKLAWDQLRRRKVVTLLCMVGIGIGSSSIIVALSFSESVTQFSEQRMGFFLKTDEIEVRPGSIYNPSSTSNENRQEHPITKQKIAMIENLPNVIGTAPFQEFGYYSFLADRTKRGNVDLVSTNFDSLPQFGYELQHGAFEHVHNGIILSYGSMMNLTDTRLSGRDQHSVRMDSMEEQPIITYPLYQKVITLNIEAADGAGQISQKQIPLRVVGILKKPDGLSDQMIQYDRTAFITEETAQQISDFLQSTSDSRHHFFDREMTLKVKMASVDAVKDTETLIQKLKLNTMSNVYQQEMMQQEFMILKIVLGGIGGFILFVASISIIVAMTMSTHQRRRQIGIIKVLGANLAQIRNMFVVEAALLGLLGGAAGILLSYWVIWGVNMLVVKFAGGPPMEDELLFISVNNLIIGLFFAIMTGILSGIFPAMKASRTDALTAIKRE